MKFSTLALCFGVVSIFLLTGFRTASAIQLHEQLSLSGFVEYEFFGYVQDTKPGQVDGRNEIQFHPEFTFTPSEKLKAFVVPEFRFDGNDEERNRIFLDEAYLDVYTESMDFRIGKQIISWGRADTMRPTDVWKIRDFTDFFDEEVEGIVGVQARYFTGDLTVTGLWIPYFQANTLPFDNEKNRFFGFPTVLPGSFIDANAGNPGSLISCAACAYTLDYRMLDPLIPEDSVEGSEGAIKFEYTYEGWDFSLSYAYLHDRIPTSMQGLGFIFGPAATDTIVLDETSDGSTVGLAAVGIRPIHRRIHMIGTDGATTFDKLGFRWEAAYFLTEDMNGNDPTTDDPYVQVTAGFDYTFTNIYEDHDLMILVQYANDVEAPQQGAKNIREGVNLRHFFQHGILAVVEYKVSEYFKVSGRGFVNVLNADHNIEPEIEWSPVDGLTLTLGGTIVGGTGGKDSFFTLFEKDDRVEAAAKYSF
ncbi:MAG: DUF1302 family protein [Bdellovibrionota bacterium]